MGNDDWFEYYCLRELGHSWDEFVELFYKKLCDMFPGHESENNKIRFYMKNKWVLPSFTFLKEEKADSIVINCFNRTNVEQVFKAIREGIDVTVFFMESVFDMKVGQIENRKFALLKDNFKHVGQENIRDLLDTFCMIAAHDGTKDPHYTLVFQDPKYAYLAASTNRLKYGKIVGCDGLEDGKNRYLSLFNECALDPTNTLEMLRSPNIKTRIKLLKKKRVNTGKMDTKVRHPDMYSCMFNKHNSRAYVTYINMHGVETQKDFNNRCEVASKLASIIAYSRGNVNSVPGVSLSGLMSLNMNSISLNEGAVIAREENKKIAEIYGVKPAEHITCMKEDDRLFYALQVNTGIDEYSMRRYKRRFFIDSNDAAFGYAKDHFALEEDALYKGRFHGEVELACPVDGVKFEHKNSTFSKLVLAEKISRQWLAPSWTDSAYINFIRVELSPTYELDMIRTYLAEHYEYFPSLKLNVGSEIVSLDNDKKKKK